MHKLTYFNAEARAEPIRVALHAAGIEFEDERLDWAAFCEAKEAGKFSTGVPLLVLPDGTEVTQSASIARYAAKKAGLYPKDDIEALKCDEIIDICLDALGKAPQASEPDEKKGLREEYAAGKLKDYAALIDSRIVGPFLLGESLCIADIMLYYFLVKMLRDGQFDYVLATYMDEFPKILAFESAIAEASVIKAWAEFRAKAT